MSCKLEIMLDPPKIPKLILVIVSLPQRITYPLQAQSKPINAFDRNDDNLNYVQNRIGYVMSLYFCAIELNHSTPAFCGECVSYDLPPLIPPVFVYDLSVYTSGIHKWYTQYQFKLIQKQYCVAVFVPVMNQQLNETIKWDKQICIKKS